MTDVTDNFNRAGPGLGSNWTNGINSIVISASTVVTGNTAAAENTAWWNANAFGSDHYSEDIVRTDVDGGGPLVRHQSGANTFYVFAYDGGGCTLYESTAGSFVALGAAYATGGLLGHTIRLDATGSTLTPFDNGTPLATRTDSSITGGAPGLHCFNNAITFDDWLGGPISSSAGATNLMPQILM
jgi:hypothetical protein